MISANSRVSCMHGVGGLQDRRIYTLKLTQTPTLIISITHSPNHKPIHPQIHTPTHQRKYNRGVSKLSMHAGTHKHRQTHSHRANANAALTCMHAHTNILIWISLISRQYIPMYRVGSKTHCQQTSLQCALGNSKKRATKVPIASDTTQVAIAL